MYITEEFLDLQLLENNPDLFVSLYKNVNLNEGMLANVKYSIADVTKNIGFALKKEKVDIKFLIKSIKLEIFKAKTSIIEDLKNGDSFGASEKLNNTIDLIVYRNKEFYKSKGIIGKTTLFLLGAFIFLMALLLLFFALIHFPLLVVVPVILIPVVSLIVRKVLQISKLRQELKYGKPSRDELNNVIVRTGEKLGVDNKNILVFLSKQTRKATNKLKMDFEMAMQAKLNNPKTKFSASVIVMIIKTVFSQISKENTY